MENPQELNKKPYPYHKSLCGFGLLGGIIGGLLFSIFNFLIDININFHPSDLLELLIILIISSIIGFLPALLMGFYNSFLRFSIGNYWDYLHLFVTGTIISFICFSFYGWEWRAFKEMSLLFFGRVGMSVIGGISSIICGKLFLPKLPKDFNK